MGRTIVRRQKGNEGEEYINTFPKLKKWITAILQNIVSNWIWYLLTAGAAALITYLSTKGF